MSVSWERAQKRLQELQKRLPETIVIELTYYDDSKEVLSLSEILKRDNSEWKLFRVVKGNDSKEVKQFLEWMCPECVIE